MGWRAELHTEKTHFRHSKQPLYSICWKGNLTNIVVHINHRIRMLSCGLSSNDRTVKLKVLKASLIFKPFKELLCSWCDTCMYSKDPNVKRNFHKSWWWWWWGGIICIHNGPSVVMKTICEFQLRTHPARLGCVTSATQEASRIQINSPGWMLNWS